MSTTAISTPTSSLQDVLGDIRARRDEIEQARRLPRDLADALIRTRIFALCIPRALGGDEGTMIDAMRTVEAISTADGSAGWCAMIGITSNAASGYMPESGAREVFADPTLPLSAIAAPIGTATRIDGGVRVSGRWPFASGITHAKWLWAGCLVMENGQPRMTPHGPEMIHVCMPVSEGEIHDTWYVSGLCGTGSNDFSATDVFIPDDRTFILLAPIGRRPEPLYQVPAITHFVFHVPCVALGIARAALDEVRELTATKVPTLYTSVLADKAVAHLEIARAEVALGSARAFLYETAESIWETVRRGDAPSPRQIALGRAAATNAAETAATVAAAASRLAGGTAIASSSPVQRHERDTSAVAHHFTMAPHTWEEAGRVLLGRNTIAPAF